MKRFSFTPSEARALTNRRSQDMTELARKEVDMATNSILCLLKQSASSGEFYYFDHDTWNSCTPYIDRVVSALKAMGWHIEWSDCQNPHCKCVRYPVVSWDR